MKENMTSGSITPQIIKFTIPLVLGNCCQLTYNVADSVIVGRYLGANALAAVGVVSPIMNIAIFFIVGICLGMSILMSEFYGKGEHDKLRREVTTAMIGGGIFTIGLALSGILLTHPLLSLLATPESIQHDAALYLRIILTGLIFTFAYNVYAASLRSIGNSKLPLYFLGISAVLNILMDLFFVIILHLGIAGVGIATITAEALSALFCYLYIQRKIPLFHFSRKSWILDHGLLRTTVSYSFVAAMQQITSHIGKVMVQGAVNTQGVASIAAFNAAVRMDDFVMTPQQNIGHANTTFIAQNRGAGHYNRICKGYNIGVRIELIYTTFMAILIYVAAHPIMQMFLDNTEQEAIQMGVHYLHIIAFFYWMPALTNIIQALFRGMGRMKVTLYSTTIQVIGRVIAAYPLVYYAGLNGVVWACVFGWACMLAYELPIFSKQWKQIKQMDKRE